MHAEVSQLRAELESTRAVAARLATLVRNRADAAALVPVRHAGPSQAEPAPGRVVDPGQAVAAAAELPARTAGNSPDRT